MLRLKEAMLRLKEDGPRTRWRDFTVHKACSSIFTFFNEAFFGLKLLDLNSACVEQTWWIRATWPWML